MTWPEQIQGVAEQVGPLASPDFVALLSGPVFAIAVASYLLIRIDKTLGEMRDTMRQFEGTMRELLSAVERRREP